MFDYGPSLVYRPLGLLPLLVFALATTWTVPVDAMAVSEAAQMAHARLAEAFFSPSGKLTLTPEIDVPDPTDPTAMLLQTTIVNSVSNQMRVEAKANAALIRGSISSLRTFCAEQEQARGNFPGPVPTVYCAVESVDFADVASAGAEGVLLQVAGGKAVSSIEDIKENSQWVQMSKSILESGMQPVLEVVLDVKAVESDALGDMNKFIDGIIEIAEFEPISILLSVGDSLPESPSDSNDDTTAEIPLPQIPKVPGRSTAILGSIRLPAKENRFEEEADRFKSAGFQGAILRAECVPGYGMNPNLEFVGKFWTACISELKSTRSKAFNFRSKNNMEKNVGTQWASYQKDVIDSGALGAMDDAFTPGLDNSKGEYKGF